MIYIFYAVISVFLSVAVHECAHIFAAKLLGEKVKKIQWHWPTPPLIRLHFEHEPDLNKTVSKKWAVIAAAGYVTTNVIGYCLFFVYHLAQNIFLRRFFGMAAGIFLLIDRLYFVEGSIRNFGDIVVIRKALHMPKWVSVLLSALVMFLDIFIIEIAF